MKLNLDDLKKLESSTVRSLALDPQAQVEAIVKVRRADYVPKNVRVRSQIDSHLFTCEIPTAQLQALQDDPNVESVAINKKLRSVE